MNDNIKIVFTDDIDTYNIESRSSIYINKSVEIPLNYYLKIGHPKNDGFDRIEYYLSDIYNGIIPPIQNKQQLLQLERIIPNWFILYNTDSMLIDHYFYRPEEHRNKQDERALTGCMPISYFYYTLNRKYAWKILEIMKDRIDFKLRTNWERNELYL